MQRAVVRVLAVLFIGIAATFATALFFVLITFFTTTFWNYIAVPVLRTSTLSSSDAMPFSALLTGVAFLASCGVCASIEEMSARE